MSHSAEPWVIGAWEQVYVGRKLYYEFRTSPESIHSGLSVWTGVKDGDRVHCREWNCGRGYGESVMSLSGEWSDVTLDFSSEDIQRMVACVNFCAGMPTEQLVKKTTDRDNGLCICQMPVAPFSISTDVFICRGCGGKVRSRKNVTPVADIETKYNLPPGSLTHEPT